MRSAAGKTPWWRRMVLGGLVLGLGAGAASLSAQEGRPAGTVRLVSHSAGCLDCCAPPPVYPVQPYAPGHVPPAPGAVPPPAPGEVPPPPGEAAPPGALPAPAPEPELAAFDPGQALAGLGLSFAAATPNMIGDLFSSGGLSTLTVPEWSFFELDEVRELPVQIPDPAATLVGLQRIAENNSPIPRDRVFVNYSYFNNTPLAPGGINVHRITPGFEKTFNEGRMSFEARFPFARTLDSNLIGPEADDRGWEFGDVTLAVKSLLYESQRSVLSTGFAVAIPTSDDLRIFGFDDDGRREFVRIENDVWLLMPFAGMVVTDGSGDFFLQGFVQGVFNAGQRDVRILDENGRLTRAGSIDPANLLLADVGIGYWMHRDLYGTRVVRGIAPTAELHWTRSLERSEAVIGGPFDTVQVGERHRTFEVLNAVFGATILLGDDSTLTVGYATPLINDRDTQFDFEVRVMFNWFFGGGLGRPGTFYR